MHEAELKVTSAGKHWEELELIEASTLVRELTRTLEAGRSVPMHSPWPAFTASWRRSPSWSPPPRCAPPRRCAQARPRQAPRPLGGRKFHLSTKKNDAKRDRDRDGAPTSSSITIRLVAGGKLTAGLAIDCSGGDSSGAATPATTRRRTPPTTPRPTTPATSPRTAGQDAPADDSSDAAVRPEFHRRPDLRRELAEARLARPRGDSSTAPAEPGGHRRHARPAR